MIQVSATFAGHGVCEIEITLTVTFLPNSWKDPNVKAHVYQHWEWFRNERGVFSNQFGWKFVWISRTIYLHLHQGLIGCHLIENNFTLIWTAVKHFRLLGLCGKRRWGSDTGKILINLISSSVTSVRVAYFYAVMNGLASDLFDRSVPFPGISVPKTVRKFLTPVLFLCTSRER